MRWKSARPSTAFSGTTGIDKELDKDENIRRVVLCSGKVYYDLAEERDKRGLKDIFIMRVEQLYPFPQKALTNDLARFKNADVVWCQEEPRIWAPGSSFANAWRMCWKKLVRRAIA